MGLDVEEDDAGSSAGADAGNLFARIPGRGTGSIMLCAHLDTVPPTAPIEPILIDSGWTNSGDGIIGADNKAAVAVLLELARRTTAAGKRPEVGLELLFTVSEENGLHGAKAFDLSRLHSRFGFVFDHATPIGEIVIASPTHQRLVAELRGRAAHAGLRPEEGRSAIAASAAAIAAMRLGRLDPETTSNVGTISGGTATNVVPERCRVEAEVRGLTDQRVEEVVTEMIDRFQDAADAAECDLDMTVERMFTAYRTKPDAPQVELAQRALRACGYEPKLIVTGGGSDANAFEAAGFPLYEPRQRNRAQPRAERARQRRRARGHAGGRDGAARGSGRGPGATGVSAEFERIGADIKWEGKIIKVGIERFRHADGHEVAREKVWHPGAVGIVAVDDTHVWLTRQPREAVSATASLEIPAGKLDVRGEEPEATAKRELAEEIGKQAAHWQEIFSFYTSPGFSDERVWLYLATDLSDTSEPGEAEEDERIEIVPWPLDQLDAAIAQCDDSKSLIALLWLLASRRGSGRP